MMALLLFLGLWLWRWKDVVEIDGEEVRVTQHRLFGTTDWALPLAAYRGLAMIRSESTDENSTNVWTLWTVSLYHKDARRSVVLYMRMLSWEDQILSDHNSNLVKEDPDGCDERTRELCTRWARSLAVPTLMIRQDLADSEPVETLVDT